MPDIDPICTAIEYTSHNELYLIRGRDSNGLCWYYAMIGNNKMQLLNGLIKLFPLKIKLSDYGKILKSGSGLNPPENIIRQIEQGDFSKQMPAFKSQIYFLHCHDDFERDYYTYLEVPYFLEAKFLEKRDSGEAFEFNEYGEILYSDWGSPTEEVKQIMRDKYGIETPDCEHA